MNATVQAMRAIPELQTALKEHVLSFMIVFYPTNMAAHSYVPGTGPQSSLTGAMRDLYNAMGKTTEGFPPYMFLQVRGFDGVVPKCLREWCIDSSTSGATVQ